MDELSKFALAFLKISWRNLIGKIWKKKKVKTQDISICLEKNLRSSKSIFTREWNWWEEESFIGLSSNDIYRISSKSNHLTFSFFVYWTIFENILDQIIIYHWFNENRCVFSFSKARNDLYISLVISLSSLRLPGFNFKWENLLFFVLFKLEKCDRMIFLSLFIFLRKIFSCKKILLSENEWVNMMSARAVRTFSLKKHLIGHS